MSSRGKDIDSAQAARAKIWRWPIVSAVASVVALTAGLVFDGWGDVVAWAGLGLPVLQCVWCGVLRQRSAPVLRGS